MQVRAVQSSAYAAVKTYTATLLAEKLFEAKVPFVAFDPIGVWPVIGTDLLTGHDALTYAPAVFGCIVGTRHFRSRMRSWPGAISWAGRLRC